jgi:hypothetical protein
MTLRAVRPVLVTAWLTVRASVLPHELLHCSPDGYRRRCDLAKWATLRRIRAALGPFAASVPPLDINVGPLQPERFTSPKSERKCHYKSHTIAHLLSGIKDASCFLYRERNNLLLFHARWLRNLSRVLDDVPTTDSFVEGDSDRAVSKVHSCRAEALALLFLWLLEDCVQRLQVFRLQFVKSVRTDSRNQMVVDR